MSKPITMVGKRFGRLTVMDLNERRGYHFRWRCLCDCGCVKIVDGNKLRSGNTKSCGCLSRELSSIRRISHGASRTPEHIAWCGMIKRCEDESGKYYSDYGGRGIVVCDRWRNSFEAFFEDMGPRPSSSHSLDRYPDNDGNYEPGNVRWATKVEQARNRRSNHLVVIDGEARCISEWAELSGVKEFTIRDRVARGVIGKEVLSSENGNYKLSDDDRFAICDSTLSAAQLASVYGVHQCHIHRIRHKASKTR